LVFRGHPLSCKPPTLSQTDIIADLRPSPASDTLARMTSTEQIEHRKSGVVVCDRLQVLLREDGGSSG